LLEEAIAALAAATEADRSAPRWWVGLSGGLDSAVLLHVLGEWRHRADLPPITALHVHHGLSDQADQWAAQAQAMATRAGVDFQLVRVDVDQSQGMGLEAAARTARYSVFEEALKPGERLLLAHHLDDQVETVVYRLLRGSGPRGLSGMPARRDLGEGVLIRPLLGLARSHLAAIAGSEALTTIQDPSNEDVGLDRNFIRHQLLSLIESRFPGYRQNIARSAQLQQQTWSALQHDRWPAIRNRFGEPGLTIKQEGSQQALATALHLWLIELGQQAPDHRRLMEFSRQILESRADRLPSLTLHNGILSRWQDAVYWHQPARVHAFPDVVTVAEETVVATSTLRWMRASPGWRQGTQLRLVTSQPGDRVPDRGRAKSARRLMQTHQVPPWWRDQLPLLTFEGQPLGLWGIASPDQEIPPALREESGWLPDWRVLAQ
jgi:tRNA(Ile)-lysidine synthase